MQFEITNELLFDYTQTFYTVLIQGQEVDQALSEARQAVFIKGNDVEWASPVLYLSTPEGHIFDLAPLSIEQQIAVLSRKVQSDIKDEEWALVVERLKAIVALDPSQAGVAESLIRARQQQELVTLYNTGYAAYEAGRWRRASETFRQIQEVERNYRDVETLLLLCDSYYRGEQLALLRQEAQAALDQEDWELAIERLQNILTLDPSDMESAAKLEQAQRQRNLIDFYAIGHAAYEAGRWREARDTFRQIQALDNNYRDVIALSSVVERKVAEEEEQAQALAQAAALEAEIRAAIEQEDWVTPPRNIETLALMGPNYTAIASDLSELYQQRLKLAELYITGHAAYEAELWYEALEPFREIQHLDSNYRDVPQLIYEIERRQTGNSGPSQLVALYPDAQPYVLQAQPEQAQVTVEAEDLPTSPPAYSPAPTYQPPYNEAAYQVPPPPPRERNNFDFGPLKKPLGVVWCIFFGWWLGLLWIVLIYVLLCVYLIFLKKGVEMLKKLPKILTWGFFEPTNPATPTGNVAFDMPHPGYVLRTLYFLLFGWWFGAIWCLTGYFMCFRSKTIPRGLEMFDRLQQALTGPKDRTSLRLAFAFVMWVLIPIILVTIVLVLLNGITSVRN
jgi:tetratricopeptide (TPR) repeat protein